MFVRAGPWFKGKGNPDHKGSRNGSWSDQGGLRQNNIGGALCNDTDVIIFVKSLLMLPLDKILVGL